MEKLLKEAQAERSRLMESRVRAGAEVLGWGSLRVSLLGEPLPLQASCGGDSKGGWSPSP